MIAFIDSGVGGINIVAECAKTYNENFVYLADNKNAPYGNLPIKQLEKITKNNIDFLISKYKLSAIVLACNTISVCVGENISAHYNIPIILTKPNIEKIKKQKKQILFFGTKNTIKNNKQITHLLKTKKDYKSLYIPDLAKMIDENINKPNNILPILKSKINNKKFKDIKTICLCCTHFKIIKKQIKKCFSHDIEFYEYEKEIAQKTLSYIDNNITKSSFNILLTKPDKQLYICIKNYLIKKLNS